MKKTHNVASLTVTPGDEFKFRVSNSGGDVLNVFGESAIPFFFTIANLVADADKKEVVH